MRRDMYGLASFCKSVMATVISVAVMALAIPVAEAGPVIAEPDSLTFSKQDQTGTIELSVAGQPIPAASIKSVDVLIQNHDYTWMFDIQKMDGALKITPTNEVEIGSYDVVVRTDKGQVTIPVYTPMSEMPHSLEEHAEAIGTTPEALRTALGLFEPVGVEFVDIELPQVFFTGQTLKLTMAAHPNRLYTFTINNEVVQQGKGEHVLSYTFKEPGLYVLGYSEAKGDTVVAADTAATRVMDEPPVEWETLANREVQLAGPIGYADYAWKIDGEVVSNKTVLSHTFGPGTHEVVCMAKTPLPGTADAFRKVTYLVKADSTGT